MSGATIKIIGLTASAIGVAAGIASDWVNDKKMEERIEEKVNEAFARREDEEEF